MFPDGFHAVIASPADYEQLVIEIYYRGLFVALVSQERGKGIFDIETPGPGLVEAQVIRKVDATAFTQAVAEACKRLSSDEDQTDL